MGNGKWQGGVTRPQAAVAPSTALAERVRIAYASAARRSHGRSPLLVYTDIRAPGRARAEMCTLYSAPGTEVDV